MIEAQKIGSNRYAAPEATDIKLYSFNGCEGLTLGQLINAVCCRIGTALEAQSVVKTNIITNDTNLLNAYSVILSGIVDGTVDYDTALQVDGYKGYTVRDFLTAQGYVISSKDTADAGQLPKNVASVNNKLLVYDVLKDKLEKLANTSQQDMIDLQTDISRRDVAFSTATNSVQALGTALQGTAANF